MLNGWGCADPLHGGPTDMLAAAGGPPCQPPTLHVLPCPVPNPQIEVRRSGRLQGDKPEYNEENLFAMEMGIDR